MTKKDFINNAKLFAMQVMNFCKWAKVENPRFDQNRFLDYLIKELNELKIKEK